MENIKNMTLCEAMEYIDQYLTEKVEWKRNMNSLLKKYNYNANDNTIKYKGNTYKVNITRNMGTSFDYTFKTTPNQKKTGSLLTDGTILINPNDFKYLSKDDMEAVLLHELGHANVNHDTKTLDHNTVNINAKHEKNNPKYSTNEFLSYSELNKVSDDQKRLILSKLAEKYKSGKKITDKETEILKKYNMLGKDITKEDKGQIERNKFANDNEKLVNYKKKDQTPHTNLKEYEADRYAADHLKNGTNRVSKMINASYRPYIKNLKNDIRDDILASDIGLANRNILKRWKDIRNNIANKDPKKPVELDGKLYKKDDALKKLDSRINNLKNQKSTMKQKKFIKDSLKDPNSNLSKNIDSEYKISKQWYDNDIKSRKKALNNNTSDSKAFTTINDKNGTDNRVNPKQKNIMAKSNINSNK